jgi:coenzyme F420 hydrogenase subunit beta
MNTISQVVKAKLCTGCGTCASICPNEAIKMRKFEFEGLYLPEIKNDKCRECGICLTCCPGFSVDFEKLNFRIFGKQPNDKLLGNYDECYIGHSNETCVRYNCASGGIVSQLLIYALEKGIIDGAIVARMRKDQPLETEAFIARTREEVLNAAKSKYCPVAINEALKHVLKQNGRFAVVGLPCHIHGIRKAEEVYKELEKKVVLHIGLMCTHTVNFKGTEVLLEKMRIRKEQVREISYRGKGWPGEMSIKWGKHSNTSIPYMGSWNAYWSVFSFFFFTPTRCMTCPDQTNELSDISVGDAWLPELKYDRQGESIVIARTKVAAELLRCMSSAGVISISQVNTEKVKQSQSLSLKFKKDDFGARLLMLKLMGKQTPQFKPELRVSYSPISFARFLLPYLNIWSSSNKHVVRLLKQIPFSLFRLYFGIYKLLSLRQRTTNSS